MPAECEEATAATTGGGVVNILAAIDEGSKDILCVMVAIFGGAALLWALFGNRNG